MNGIYLLKSYYRENVTYSKLPLSIYFTFILSKLEFVFTSHISKDYLHWLKTLSQINITE